MGEIEVMMPGQSTTDFDMKNGNFSSPGLTAPSSPAHIEEDYYFSAPASPRQISQFYREFDDFLINNSSMINNSPDVRRNSVSLTVPFDWEEKPGVPKNKFEDDFAFDVSQEMEIASVSADELFRGGKIRPLVDISTEKKNTEERAAIRGRERSVSSLSASRSGHRVTRSVSPLRVSEYPWEEEFRKHQEQQQNHQQQQQSSKQSSSKPNLTSSVSALSSSSLKGHKKWKLKDFFLFRSASEGRATDKSDPLKKYASLFKKQDDIKCSSFRSIDNNSVNSVHSSRRKGPPVSPHELHYTMNRAVSEDLKKKTFLPYKQGILGRLSFNPAVHAIANGFGFSRK